MRSLSEYCQFGAFLEEALRDRFVCGVHSPQLRKTLLSKEKLDLEKALKIAYMTEKAELETSAQQTSLL